ncbi:Octaprenyl diphosphate synthase [Providencia stuartii]|nr:Octaprenyl diphosphate synthase [Providencia stuartii]
MNLESIVELTSEDMSAVNEAILSQLNSDVALINQLGYYIVSGGGKRIRPMIAVLAGRSLGYSGQKHIQVAALIEFIHTATLLHDDVVDESDMRRGKQTANAVFGNAASVLVGDFIYTRSFQMMTDLDSMRVLKLMSEATNVIAEGEVLQLMNCNDPNITEENYMQVIYSKTARLFEAAAHASAILASATPEQEKALQDYGRYLGTAFQLIDDLLDYDADNKQLGKNTGDDLDEGEAYAAPTSCNEPWNRGRSRLDPPSDRAGQWPSPTGHCAGNYETLRLTGVHLRSCKRGIAKSH